MIQTLCGWRAHGNQASLPKAHTLQSASHDTNLVEERDPARRESMSERVTPLPAGAAAPIAHGTAPRCDGQTGFLGANTTHSSGSNNSRAIGVGR